MKNKKNKTKSNATNNNENKEKEGEMKFSQTLLSSKIGSVLTKRPYDLNLSHKTEKIENPFHEILIRDDVLSEKECDSIVASICSIFEYQLATSRGPKFGEARRKNNRMSFADEKLAKMLWEDIGLKTMFIRSDETLSRRLGFLLGKSNTWRKPSSSSFSSSKCFCSRAEYLPLRIKFPVEALKR